MKSSYVHIHQFIPLHKKRPISPLADLVTLLPVLQFCAGVLFPKLSQLISFKGVTNPANTTLSKTQLCKKKNCHDLEKS